MIAALLAEAAKDDEVPLWGWFIIALSIGIILGGLGKRSS